MTTDVQVQVRGGVATLTMNRPHRRNAYTYALQEELHRALREADADQEVRAIVVTGSEGTFCPGMDPALISGVADGGARPERPPAADFLYPLTLQTVTIAAINGACAGVGLALALTCDLRIMAAGARLSTGFVRLGLPAERGMSWLLPRIAGHSRALDLLLTGRILDADKAHSYGLVTQVAPTDSFAQSVQAYAEEIAASSSPTAMTAIKRQVYSDWTNTLDSSVVQADEELDRLLAHPEFKARVAALGNRGRSRDNGPPGSPRGEQS